MIMNAGPAVPQHDAVVLYHGNKKVPDHEAVVHRDIAMRLARMLHLPFDGHYDPSRHATRRCFFVPSTTIVGAQHRTQLGITSEQDLFGGYVDHSFLCTKAITHALPHADATRPAGWTDEFGEAVKEATLPGFTAFSIEDIRRAAQQLFDAGWVVRLKPVNATAGRGQVVVSESGELEAALSDLDTSSLSLAGIVLEAHLDDVITYSVGQVRLPGLIASYIGTQCLTPDNTGELVYGGSTLEFCRGGFDALERVALEPEYARAVRLARCYDSAADAHLSGFVASRRNYDIAAGNDRSGTRHTGVLEQSWRIGGASRAEVAALETFLDHPECHSLRAETIELFGHDAAPPKGAIETFCGTDPDIGLIRKYVRVESHGNNER